MKQKDEISIIPLGGREEIGNNMILVEYNDQILVLDCGVMFPTDQTPGVDLIIPNMSYLIENQERAKAALISHAHEDHIGSIPFLLQEIDLPIYGTKFTTKMIEKKLKDNHLDKTDQLQTIKPGQTIELAPFEIEFITLTHSIPGSAAISIKTPLGTILYTGDFKLDHSPINEPTDFNSLTNLGEEGVLALLSDSTNAEQKGYSLSEKAVQETINDIFSTAKGRILISTFSSQLDRIQQIINAAAQTERKIALFGRSMHENTKLAVELGYLDLPEEQLINSREVNNFADDELVLLMTGSQGEPMAALSRLARKEHRQINIKAGDTVILSATPIPGNEIAVGSTINQLFAQGAKVIYGRDLSLHASGHAYQEELKMMLDLTKPKYFIPVHGEYRHLYHHALLAQEVGIPNDQIFITKNGSRLNINSEKAYFSSDSVPADRVYIEGGGVGDLDQSLLTERNNLAENGLLMIALSISKKSGELLADPKITTQGFNYYQDSKVFLTEVKKELKKIFKKAYQEDKTHLATLKKKVKEFLSAYIYQQTRRSPIILPLIMKI
ncbi:ribonuclease J [Natroniella sulfidigena]|uniref:ribonuclease J n=1 Tax=Natroniella sulfidigena TaxID=723921 RepID=UPI00200A1633|nr:ribonuclease J [Natroniella sulfidigena]MCK8817041.1 ribonuclease J [Natroniella sulfidigena]